MPRRAERARPPASIVPPLSLAHPATLVTAAVAFACIAFSVTYRIFDPDFWQHLLAGRVIWQTHSIPHEHLWSWVSYGKPEPLQSWLFCALLWPFYSASGVTGLYLWRWISTLAAFAILWAAARRMGARGLTPLVALVWCAWIFRVRTQLRPEMVAAVLMALAMWLLESRRARAGGAPQPPSWRDPAWGLVPIVWVWANAHASYFIAFVLLAIHWADAALRGRGRAELRRLVPVALAMVAIGFANPFGWRTLWLPFDYALHLSRETLFRGISELAPLGWSGNARSGVWILIFLWPLLALWRAWRAGPDWAELATCALSTAYVLPSQRFVGVYALAAAPYLGRDLDELARTWPRPAWLRVPTARAALASALCVGVGIPEALRPVYAPRIGIEMERVPVAAADFMEHHDVRGHGFSHFRQVGYLAWRFWPDRGRLPFTDIHQTGTAADREAFAESFIAPRQVWANVSRHYGLDYAVLDRRARLGADLLDVLDADSAWAMVFVDDAAALYVRRASFGALADSFAYRILGGGAQRVAAIAQIDSAGWEPLRSELQRSAAQSPWSSRAYAVLTSMALAQGRVGEARAHLERVLAADPRNAQARALLRSLSESR